MHQGQTTPQSRWPGHVTMSGRRLTQREHQHFLELQQRRDRQAEALGIDPTLIASKAVLAGLAQDGNTTLRSLMGWQRALLDE